MIRKKTDTISNLRAGPSDSLPAAVVGSTNVGRSVLESKEKGPVFGREAELSVITVNTPPAMRRSSPFGTFSTVGEFE